MRRAINGLLGANNDLTANIRTVKIIQLVFLLLATIFFVLFLWTCIAASETSISAAAALKRCAGKSFENCMKELADVFLPWQQSLGHYRLSFKLSEAGYLKSPAAMEVGFPLTRHNPFLMLTLSALAIFYVWLLQKYRRFLERIQRPVAPLADVRAFNRLEEEEIARLN